MADVPYLLCSQLRRHLLTPDCQLVVGLSFGDCIGIVLFAILGYLYGKTRKGGAGKPRTSLLPTLVSLHLLTDYPYFRFYLRSCAV